MQFKHRLDLTNKVIRRLFNGVKEAHFKHWMLVVKTLVTSEQKLVKMLSCLSKINKQNVVDGLRRAWFHWKLEATTSSILRVKAQSDKKMGLRMIAISHKKWVLRYLVAGFRSWATFSSTSKNNAIVRKGACRLMKQVVMKVIGRGLRRGFGKWLSVVRKTDNLESVYKVVVTMRVSKVVKRALWRWCLVAKSSMNWERGIHVVKRIFVRYEKSAEEAGFRAFKRNYRSVGLKKDNQERMEFSRQKILKMAVLKTMKRLKLVGFYKWCEATQLIKLEVSV